MRINFYAPLCTAFLLTLVSCNGGGAGGASGVSSGSILSGVAAIGAPLGNAKLTVLGKACEVIDETDSNGQYSVALSTCEGPYLLRAENELATVHSIASSSDFGKNVSITPVTELIAGRVLGTTALGALDKDDIAAEDISSSDIIAKKNEIKAILASILEQEDVGDFDLINSSFTADGTRFDKILDVIDISPKDSHSFSFKIKGTSLDIDLSMTQAEVAPSSDITLISGNAAAASASGDFLSELRERLNAFNNTLKSVSDVGKQAAVLEFFSPDFLHGGMNRLLAYEKHFSFYKYVEFSNPVLLHLDSSGPNGILADVFVGLKEFEEGDDGIESSGSYKLYMRFKKVDGQWYFYGDQMPLEVEISSLNIKLNNTFHRGLLVDLDTDSAGSVINISSSLFTTGISIDGQIADIQDSSLKIGCTHDADYCKSFLKLSDSASLPNFLKVNVSIGGSSFYTYTTTPKIINSSDSFPSFNNIPEGGMCGEFDSTSYPASVGFSIPADHLGLEYIEANSLVNGASGLTHDLYSSNQSYEETLSFVTNDFRQNFSPYTGPVSVDKFNMSISSANAFGLYVRSVYSCGL